MSNRGYLGTYGLPSARKLPHSEPLRLTAEGTGVKLVAPAESIVEIGHLDGWGSGLYNGANIFMPWTRGNVHEKFVTLVVEGRGRLHGEGGQLPRGIPGSRDYRVTEIVFQPAPGDRESAGRWRPREASTLKQSEYEKVSCHVSCASLGNRRLEAPRNGMH